MRAHLAFVLLLAALAALTACADPPATPEDAVRSALAEIEAAAEAGDVGAFKQVVSERYEDPLGHDKQRLMAFLTFHVLRNQRGREVLLRVRDLQIVQEGRAAVVIHVGLAGSGGSMLRANVYEVALTSAREDEDWRLTWAEWQVAPPAALL
jgi:hypothetical protein